MESKPEAPPVAGWGDPPAQDRAPAVAGPPPTQRIGTAEREQTERHLRWALAEDVLTIGEFDDRLGHVIRAKTREDLDRIVADLPPPQTGAPPRTSLRPCTRIVAVLGGEDKRGRWRPGRPLRVLAVMGGVKIDLRDAESDDGVFDIDALAVMGGVEIVVPDDAEVDLDGFAVMGGRDNKVPAPQAAGGPLVRVNGYAVMGGIEVRPASKRERKKYPLGVDDGEHPQQQAPRPPVRYGDVSPRRKSWVGRAIGWSLFAVLALGPGQAAATADALAIFGGTEYSPSDAELAGDDAVEVFSMFGGVKVLIPEGYTAAREGLSLFGGVSCDHGACEREGDQVQVNATAVFGGVSIVDQEKHAAEEAAEEADD